MTSGYVPLASDYGVYHLRLRRHSASSLPPPPCLFTALPACPPARLVTGYCSRSLYLARSLPRSPARLSSSSSCSSREIYIFLIRFSFFWRFYNLLESLFLFFVLEKNSLRRNFFLFFCSFFGFLHSLELHAFPFLASFASASSWLPFVFFCVFFVPDLGLQLFCS